MIEYVNGPCSWDGIAPSRLRQQVYGDPSLWEHYSTSRLLDGSEPRILHKAGFADLEDGPGIHIELLPTHLTTRWRRTGLCFAAPTDVERMNFRQVLERSLGLIRRVEPILGTVSGLCRSLHVLKASGYGFDCSYSDPLLPFSIFASCPMPTENNGAERLAENIVHEALHLQLSLVETIEPSIAKSPEASDLYSPWKGERRPVQGVLQGVYVFGNLRCFWARIAAQFSTSSSFAEARIKEIDDELASVQDLARHSGLTRIGRSIAKSLLGMH